MSTANATLGDINVVVSTDAGKKNIWKAIRICVGIAKGLFSKLEKLKSEPWDSPDNS
ncbi:hypothetical protein [Labilibaculum euxinus]